MKLHGTIPKSKITTMKNLFISVLALLLSFTLNAQLKVKATCAALYVDVLDGKVNGIKPDITIPELKEMLPCFTGVDEESARSKCGGGVYYKDKDIYFYTKRDYIEIGEKFQGKLSIPILGASRGSLFKWLGNPKLKDTNWDAFQMSYGTLVLHYNPAGKVRLIQFSTNGVETLSLCE
jgi:hypothetical protein